MGPSASDARANTSPSGHSVWPEANWRDLQLAAAAPRDSLARPAQVGATALRATRADNRHLIQSPPSCWRVAAAASAAGSSARSPSCASRIQIATNLIAHLSTVFAAAAAFLRQLTKLNGTHTAQLNAPALISSAPAKSAQIDSGAREASHRAPMRKGLANHSAAPRDALSSAALCL